MDLLQLDINQCDDKFNVPNAFKGTHKCDKKSSYVSYFYLSFFLSLLLSRLFSSYIHYFSFRFFHARCAALPCVAYMRTALAALIVRARERSLVKARLVINGQAAPGGAGKHNGDFQRRH